MIQKIYCIYDKVAEEAGPLQCCKNDGIAARMLKQSVSQVTFPDDYKLLLVGSYDTEKVQFVILPEPVEVFEATEVEE